MDSKDPVALRLQIRHLPKTKFEVRVLESPMGEPRVESHLPYSAAELDVILKCLQNPTLDRKLLTPDEIETLGHCELLAAGRLAPDFLMRVGQALYQALITGDIRSTFQMAHNRARSSGTNVFLQLRFDEDATRLACYPWELLHDSRRFLVSSGAVDLARYISYSEAPTQFEIFPPISVLYLAPRPVGLAPLACDEGLELRRALAHLNQTAGLEVLELEAPTLDGLLDHLEERDVHIVHFDGHGAFGRQCPYCKDLNHAQVLVCGACGADLTVVEPQGFLAFEDGTARREVHWVSSVDLGQLCYGTSICLMVLSACESGLARGRTVFTGSGQSLIQAGVPAVVAMVLPVKDRDALAFTRGFYRTLARSHSIMAAVHAGRRRLLDRTSWFVPVLYLRSDYDEVSFSN